MEEVELCDDRLYLRPPRLGDAGQIYAACQDAEIQRWTTVPSPYSRADAEMFRHRARPDPLVNRT
jgi:RimJ/RimL family protein N-acetyltransferase